jgi:tRNA/tmRNA/rRNA uracil-C5-methylase (TrmA/RlmC/RlmD family)
MVDCPVFYECGGCDFRHISYEEELYAKRKKVNDALSKISGVNVKAEKVLSTGNIYNYRNNTQFKIDGEKIGFFRPGSHEVVGINQCLIASEQANKAIKNHKNTGIKSLQIRTATETLDNLKFNISPDSFFQVNTEAALLLYEKAAEYADLKPTETLLDLYCGTGSITLFLGRYAKTALGVELNASAVSDAKENAKLNNINNVDFLCADVSQLDVNIFKPDCIVVDPPRKGLSPDVIHKIDELKPSRIIYISCNPATLARDIKLFENYEVNRVSAVDLFPRTKHVEVIAKLVLR